jgi:hypothetical protein
VRFPEAGVHRCLERCTVARVKPHRAIRSKQQLPGPQPHMLAQEGHQVVQPAVLDRLGGVADNLRVVELDALAQFESTSVVVMSIVATLHMPWHRPVYVGSCRAANEGMTYPLSCDTLPACTFGDRACRPPWATP